jgi:hypothetical protein
MKNLLHENSTSCVLVKKLKYYFLTQQAAHCYRPELTCKKYLGTVWKMYPDLDKESCIQFSAGQCEMFWETDQK